MYIYSYLVNNNRQTSKPIWYQSHFFNQNTSTPPSQFFFFFFSPKMSTSPFSTNEQVILDNQTLFSVNMTNVTKLTSSNHLMCGANKFMLSLMPMNLLAILMDPSLFLHPPSPLKTRQWWIRNTHAGNAKTSWCTAPCLARSHLTFNRSCLVPQPQVRSGTH